MLMSGSTNDAIMHLNYAREEQKRHVDNIWLASSLETSVCAQIFKEMSKTGTFVYSDVIA